jgi:hypothetical protein
MKFQIKYIKNFNIFKNCFQLQNFENKAFLSISSVFILKNTKTLTKDIKEEKYLIMYLES